MNTKENQELNKSKTEYYIMGVGSNLRRRWLGQKTQSNQVGGESLEHHWYQKTEKIGADYQDISAPTQPKPPSSLLSED